MLRFAHRPTRPTCIIQRIGLDIDIIIIMCYVHIKMC